MGMLCQNLAPFLEKHSSYEGGGRIGPPPADFKHLQTLPVIGLILFSCIAMK